MKFKFMMEMSLVGCKKEEIIELDDENFEGMSADDLENAVDEMAHEWMHQNIDYWAERMEG